VFRLVDLADAAGRIRGLRATGATFFGPAVVVALEGTWINEPTWDPGAGGIEAVIWEIDPAREKVLGVVVLDQCLLEDCTFVNVGYAARPEGIAAFASGARVTP